MLNIVLNIYLIKQLYFDLSCDINNEIKNHIYIVGVSKMELRQAAIDNEKVVVFLIGMRSIKWWKISRAFKIGQQMSAMQKELTTQDVGCLNVENWFGRTTISLQYWRSFEELEAYAHASTHLNAWKKFAYDGSIAIWHETYEVNRYEAVYAAMPPFGLGKAIGTVPAKGAMKTARKRIEASVK